MNGRCQKDALDRAEDICELCGDQFCADCLLFPRGHRNPPTCKACALANSGLRGSGGNKKPISRREYKKRKKELLAQLEGVEEAAPAIQYFDLNDPSSFEGSTELDRRAPEIEEPETVDILGRLDEPSEAAGDGDDDSAAATPPPPPTGPSTAVPPPPAPTSPPPPAPTPLAPSPAPVDDPTPVAGSAALSGFAPVDTSVNPLAVDSAAPAPQPVPPSTAAPQEAVSEASATAADLLARLKADQPIQSQFTSSTRPLDVDPFTATTSSPPVVPPTQAIPPAAGPPPAPSAPSAPISPTSDPFASSTSSSPPPRPKTEPWTPPAIPPRGSNLDAMGGNTPPDAPPSSPKATPEALRPPEPSESDPTVEEEPRPGRAADTDGSGQWIPPSLRGMASPEDRAADPLPRRR